MWYIVRRTIPCTCTAAPGRNKQVSPFELNCAKKAHSVRRVKYLELEFPPSAILCRWGGRIFWPKAGILVLRRSLGKSIQACQIRENREICACGAKILHLEQKGILLSVYLLQKVLGHDAVHKNMWFSFQLCTWGVWGGAKIGFGKKK